MSDAFLNETDFLEEEAAAAQNRKSSVRNAFRAVALSATIGAVALYLTGGRVSIGVVVPTLAVFLSFAGIAWHHRSHAVWRENHIKAERLKIG